MFGVIGSYLELTGFQSVKLTDECSAAVVSANVLPLDYCPFTPINSH